MRSLKLQLLKVSRIHEAIKDDDMTGARVLLPLTLGGGLAFIVGRRPEGFHRCYETKLGFED